MREESNAALLLLFVSMFFSVGGLLVGFLFFEFPYSAVVSLASVAVAAILIGLACIINLLLDILNR